MTISTNDIVDYILGKKHPGYKRFMCDLRKIARRNEVELRFQRKKLVRDDDYASESLGYFGDTVLSVACNNPFDTVMGIMVHESCHMDQSIEDTFLWDKCSAGYTVFFQWLEDKKIVKREVLEESVQDIIRLELDCEKRSVKKILKYGLPINVEEYIQKANAYLYGYLFFLEKKKWIPEIYTDQSVYNLAQTEFQKSYTKIPGKLRKAFEKVYKNL